MKVYVVFDGDSENQTLLAVFSTREKAEAYTGPACNVPMSGYWIEVYELDETRGELVKPNFTAVIDLRSGRIVSQVISYQLRKYDEKAEIPKVTRYCLGNTRSLRVRSVGSSEDIGKIASEARQAYLRDHPDFPVDLDRVNTPGQGSIVEAVDVLREASGKSRDSVDDPKAYLN